jgi:RimJ/RimL family protein N-acetyltransferase
MDISTIPPAPDLEGVLADLSAVQITDAKALTASASDPQVWQGKLVPRPTTVAEVRELIVSRRHPECQMYTVRRRTDGAVLGSTSLGNFDLQNGCVEMGFTWLDRAAWGQGYNEDMKLCLLKYCFEDLGLVRVEWQVDAQNERSRRALQRLQFTYEGTLRSRHERPDGTRRDSQVFSLLAFEWPEAQAHLQRLVAERSAPQTEFS